LLIAIFSAPLYPPIIGVNMSTLIVSSILVNDTSGKTFNATRFGVQCTVLGYVPKSVDDGARFDVSFQLNGQPFMPPTYTLWSNYSLYLDYDNFNSYITIYPTYWPQNELVYIIDESLLIGHLGNTVRIVQYWGLYLCNT